uniref:Uncharacterized protein n=1 Tax=Medicago truncatula TaxID=3880 RepID=B7FLV1_MEDTR|nr:unknown [Medicago truncatula]
MASSLNLSTPSLSRPRACKNFKLLNGFNSLSPSMINVRGSDFAFVRLSSKFPSCRNAALTSGGGDLKNEDLVGVESAQPNAVALGTLGADTTLTGSGFSDDNDDFDSDSPTKGFASIPGAIEDIRNGKMVVVVDDEDRENEGDLIMAAQLATPEAMARLPKLRQFAERENLKIISIADLIRYRRKRDKLVERAGAALIPTMWGPFEANCYRSLLDGMEHIAMVKGDIGDGM